MEPYKASVKFDISYEPPRHFLRQRESHILSEPVSNLFSIYTRMRCWEDLSRTASWEEI